MPDATENEISETLVSPGSSQLEIDASTSAGGDQIGLAPPTYPLRVFKTIASATQGPRNETSLATYLVPKPQKRHANNFTGVTGTERCTFCVKAKKKCVFTAHDQKCQRCGEKKLDCGAKRRPGADRLLRRLESSKKNNVQKPLSVEALHDLEILGNERWDEYQRPWVSDEIKHSVLSFGLGLCSFSEYKACIELDKFVQHLVFESGKWRPASNTSVMITLQPIDGFRRRYWINGNLIGWRDFTRNYRQRGIGAVNEICVMIERLPRFPTMKSLEEYVKSRLPYEEVSGREIELVAQQIEKRFKIIGKFEVREFYLRRKPKKNMVTIDLRWAIPPAQWGFSTWKAYFRIRGAEVFFVSSRVSVHVCNKVWSRHRLPSPWMFWVLGTNVFPRQNIEISATRPLSFLQICQDLKLERDGIIFTMDDDPITGLPEDTADVPVEILEKLLREEFELRPSRLKEGVLEYGWWRFVPPDYAKIIHYQLAEFTDDPNIIPPEIISPPTQPGELPPVYSPRIPPRPPRELPRMMVIMLGKPVKNAFPSGFFIIEGEANFVDKSMCPGGQERVPVIFKNTTDLVYPADWHRFVHANNDSWETVRRPYEVTDPAYSQRPSSSDIEWADQMLNFDDNIRETTPTWDVIPSMV